MKRTHKINQIIYLLVSFMTCHVMAENSKETLNEIKRDVLPLYDYVMDVLTAHPRVREQVHIYRQTLQDEVIAKSGWLPSVDLGATTEKVDRDGPLSIPSQRNDFSSQRTELSVTQNIFEGFATKYEKKQTQARAKAALFELYDTADNIALDAIQAYFEVLKQHQLLTLAKENLASHQETLDKIRKRSQSGAGRRSQLEQTEGRVARAHAGYIAQQNNLQDALTTLHEILGRYVLAEELQEPSLPNKPLKSIERLTEQALAQHPAMKVASFNVDAALFDQAVTRKNRYPRVDIRLAKIKGNDLNGIPGDVDETRLSLNFQYNFYRGGADKAEERKKVSVVHEQQQFAARVRRQVINTLRLAWTADTSLNSQLKFLKKHVDKSRQTMSLYREEFFIGQRDLIDLLDAKNELNSAQNQYTEAYYESLISRFRVYEGFGELFTALGININLDESDFTIGRVKAKGKDKLPLNQDYDNDAQVDKKDQCDNTLEGSQVNLFGCKQETIREPVNLKYPSKIQAPKIIQQTEKEIIKKETKPQVPEKKVIKEKTIQQDMEKQSEQGDGVVIRAKRNLALQAVNDSWGLEQNGIFIITSEMLLDNDFTLDKNNVQIVSYSQPETGDLAMNDKKAFVYRSKEGFVGIDVFNYTIKDIQGNTSTAQVSIVIPPETEISLTRDYFLNFKFDKTELTEMSNNKLYKIINELKKFPHVHVNFYAYTDSKGSDKYNLDLSKRRANSVKSKILSKDIHEKRIKVYALGESNPIASNATEEGRAINRRGVFRFQSAEKIDNQNKK